MASERIETRINRRQRELSFDEQNRRDNMARQAVDAAARFSSRPTSPASSNTYKIANGLEPDAAPGRQGGYYRGATQDNRAVRKRAQALRERELGRAGVDAAMEFNARPFFITGDSGQLPDAYMKRPRANFSNVQGRVDTVAGAAPEAAARRGRPMTDVAPGASAVAPNLASRPSSDKERRERLSDVNDAIRHLTMFGGGLNMASKRRLFGDLIGQKNDLTTTAYEGENRANIARAGIQADVAQSNAALAERAAGRRDAAQMFDTETGDRRFEYDTTRASQDNFLDQMIKDAKAQRESDAYNLKRRGVQDEADYGRVDKLTAELINAGVDPIMARSQARQSLVGDIDATNQDFDTTPLVAGAKENVVGVAKRLSQDRPFFQKLFDGQNPLVAAPAVQGDSYPFEQLSVEQTPLLQRAVDAFLPGDQIKPYYVTGPKDAKGMRVRQPFDTAEEANELVEAGRRAARLRRKTSK